MGYTPYLVKNKRRRVKRSRRGSGKVRQSGWRRFFRWLGWLVLIGFVIGVIAVGGVFLYFAQDLPEAGAIRAEAVAESTKIFDRSGEHLLYEIHGEEKRTVIPFEQIPSVVKFATIALEDQDFYNHPGINIKSIARAAMSQVIPGMFGRSSGGSTITQQLIKNTLLTPEQTIERKIREVILSLELERKFSKDEILAMYLNEIPYGQNAYGIEAAARTYFDKSARDLTLDEAAMLASLPQQPSRYSPYGKYQDRLIKRKDWALRQMADLGYITKEEMDGAIATKTLDKTRPNVQDISAPHFVMYIREYLEEGYEKGELEGGGLRIYTTLDWDKQQIAERVVSEGAAKNAEKYNATNAALVAIDPKTGQVLAMVGSADYFNKEIDGEVNVTTRFRQPGSSFKPYVFLGAFIKGYTPETILYDVPTNFADGDEPYAPRNYDGTFKGPVKIKKALGMSLNIPAVKALYLVGVKNTIALAKDLGLEGLNQPDRYGLALVLGGGEVKLLNHTRAYATLANEGVRQPLVSILRIEDTKGNVLEQYKPSDGERVVDMQYVAMLDHVLSTNKYRLPAFAANNPLRFDTRPVAAKTGTTNEYRDAWTMGYTPSLAVGVWTGNSDNTKMSDGAAGSVVAGPIWRAFITEVLADEPIEHFPGYKVVKDDKNEDNLEGDSSVGNSVEPSEIDVKEDQVLDGAIVVLPKKWMLNGQIERTGERIKVCRISKKKNIWCLSSDACDKDKKKKREFVNARSILYYVDKNDPLGDAPDKPTKDPQYKLWEKGVKKFYQRQADGGAKIVLGVTPTKKCKKKDF